jgi:hypothetical protein
MKDFKSKLDKIEFYMLKFYIFINDFNVFIYISPKQLQISYYANNIFSSLKLHLKVFDKLILFKNFIHNLKIYNNRSLCIKKF